MCIWQRLQCIRDLTNGHMLLNISIYVQDILKIQISGCIFRRDDLVYETLPYKYKVWNLDPKIHKKLDVGVGGPVSISCFHLLMNIELL